MFMESKTAGRRAAIPMSLIANCKWILWNPGRGSGTYSLNYLGAVPRITSAQQVASRPPQTPLEHRRTPTTQTSTIRTQVARC